MNIQYIVLKKDKVVRGVKSGHTGIPFANHDGIRESSC